VQAGTPMRSDGRAELGLIAVEKVDLNESSRLVLYTDPEGPGADRFRFLSMRLREHRAMEHLRTLLVTSPRPGDGKSTLALNLATALVEGGKRTVLLVEADYYHPTLGPALGLPDGPGLADCLEDNLDPLKVVRRLDPLHWYFLRAGKPRSNPTDLLQSDMLSGLMQRLRGLSDWILIDAPPAVPLADALSLSRHADASLLVVRASHTPQEALEEALTVLGPQNVLGVVLNGAEGLNRLYSTYYRYYGDKKRVAAHTTPEHSGDR
jgi:capsular exopolysaccharide synthesis family protein